MQPTKEEKKEINTMPVFTLMVDEKEPDLVTLKKDGKICSCPYRVPYILPTQDGLGRQGMSITPSLCTNLCQFFKISNASGFENAGKFDIQLQCVPGKEFVAAIEQTKAPVNPLKGSRFE